MRRADRVGWSIDPTSERLQGRLRSCATKRTAVAYLQPDTRAEISRLAGREISRDVIARLKRLELIDAGLRAPQAGAPFAYVTTKKFLEVFGLATLRDLPDVERLEDEGLLQRRQLEADLDGALGFSNNDGQVPEEDLELDGAEFEETADAI